jgi:hypothetical protein
MFGKGALIFVAGFAMVFGLYTAKLNKLAVGASDNFNYHYVNQLIHESGMTAMNMAINDIWANDTNTASYSITANSCTTQVSVTSTGADTIICKTVTRGYVFDDEYYILNNLSKQIVDSMWAIFTYDIPASQFFWYTNVEGHIYWVTGDTVWGPMHTNDRLRTSGAPVFYGKITARSGITPGPTDPASHAEFLGGWEVGTNAPLPTDMSAIISEAATASLGYPINTMSSYDQDLELEFFADGTVGRKVGSSPRDTVLITDIAPNGVIHNTNKIRVQGVFNGQLTIYTENSIFIDDDIVYAVNPLVDITSDDFLGLVADRDIKVTDNPANNNDCHIHASMMAIGGSFGASNYNGRPHAGALHVLGSISQDRRGPIGTFGMTQTGFQKRYSFDPRLATVSPPLYPSVRMLTLASWWE